MRVELTPAEVDRFWSKIARSSIDQCWAWKAETNNMGYGRFVIYRPERCRLLAHRVAFELASAPIADGLKLLHSCDNPPCCNPAHLRPGTQRENLADAFAKGRRSMPPHPRGEDHPRALLTQGDVDEICRAYGSGDVTQAHLGDRFGVNQVTISRIVRGLWGGTSPDERARMLTPDRRTA